MKKFAFSVDIVSDSLDSADVVASIRQALADSLPGDVHASVKAGGVTEFSEQGYKVWRARVTGVTAKDAGDAANPRKSKKAEQAVAEEASA